LKPEWSVWALKITKIQKQKHSEKQLPHETAKNVFLDTGGGGLPNDLFSLKITTIPEIVHMAPRASKITARVSKMTARASKMIEI
jgi:hypothetical protein